ncbi:MAG: transglutaminase family protein [Akkermansiaceae bacterium]
MAAPIISLLTLLDDENTQVRAGVQKALLAYEGDAAPEIAAAGIRLKKTQARLLSKHLHPGRRETLRREWAVPKARLNVVDGDWDSLEDILRLISDFLHDGITMRQSLSDELDQLAEQADKFADTPMTLAHYLFATQKFSGNSLRPFHVLNSDLAWCIQEGESNPLGLSLIYMLVGHRLQLPVFGCNYPGHFLALIDHQNEPTLIDTFHNGRPTPIRKLLKEHPEISADANKALRQPCTLLEMLRRLLANLHFAFSKVERTEDADLINELILTLD